MHQLPEPPAAPAAGQTTPLSDAVVTAAVDHFIEEAKRNGTSPRTVIGTAPPVAQPGMPAQSRAAVDYAVRVLSTGVATGLGSGGLALVLLASQAADPVVCGIVFGAPIGLAVPIAALASLAKRVKQATPPDVHHHYNGPVHQDQRRQESKNIGVWARGDNRQ